MTGVSIEVTLDDRDLRAALAGLVDAARDMAPAMDEIGSMLVASTLNRFERGVGPDGIEWPPSLRALEQSGQTLVDSGRLMGSITHVPGPDSVEVGTNVIYGAIHQLGGKAGRGRKVTIPARPYLGVDADDGAEICAILIDHLEGATR